MDFQFFRTLLTLLPLNMNPNTSDPNAGIIGFVIAALILSSLLIIGYLVWSAKKKKGKGQKKK